MIMPWNRADAYIGTSPVAVRRARATLREARIPEQLHIMPMYEIASSRNIRMEAPFHLGCAVYRIFVHKRDAARAAALLRKLREPEEKYGMLG